MGWFHRFASARQRQLEVPQDIVRLLVGHVAVGYSAFGVPAYHEGENSPAHVASVGVEFFLQPGNFIFYFDALSGFGRNVLQRL